MDGWDTYPSVSVSGVKWYRILPSLFFPSNPHTPSKGIARSTRFKETQPFMLRNSAKSLGRIFIIMVRLDKSYETEAWCKIYMQLSLFHTKDDGRRIQPAPTHCPYLH